MTQLIDGLLKDNIFPEQPDRPVIFPHLPISPSSNNQYVLHRRIDKRSGRKKTYYVPSQELRNFKKEMDLYPLKSKDEFNLNRVKILTWLKQGKLLEVNALFLFKKERIFTLKGKPKKFDVSNRLKALHDCLCKILGIDDSVFFKIQAEKACCNPQLSESCCVKISYLEY